MAGRQGRRPTPEEIQERSIMIEDALDAGALSWVDIQKATELSNTNIRTVFKYNPELHKKYRIQLMQLKTQASANIINAVCDPNNKDHFRATELFLRKYKTDLDEIFERHPDGPGFSITQVDKEGNESKPQIKITFTPQDSID